MRLHLLVPLLLAACATAPVTPPRSPAPPPRPEVLRLQRPAGGEWLGLFLLGQKAGWLHADTVEDSFEGRPAIRAEISLALELQVGGNVARRTSVDRRWYERREGGRLLGFEAIRRGDGGNRHVAGSCDEARCAVAIADEGGVVHITVPLPPETADDADPVRLAAARRGTVAAVWLDLDELEEKRASHRFDGEEGGHARVITEEGGETFVTLLDEKGATREVQLGPGLLAVAASEEEARAIGTPADVFALTSVPVPDPLPEAPAAVVFEIEGLPERLWREDGRQRFEALGGGAVRVRIVAEPAATAPAEDDFALYKSFLRTSPSVDWDTPAVRALADAIRAEAASPRALAEALLLHVHERLEKVYGASSDRASRVLREGKGDCTEHALLFVALARAAGLPARQVHGLALADGGAGRALYWHEWAEVHLEGGWVAVDPTFGQFPADASHLALGQERDAGATRVLGQLRIRKATAPPVPAASFR